MKTLMEGDIPDGYKFAAVDSDGYAYAYENKPTLYYKLWIYGGKIVHLGVDFDAKDWTTSLVEKKTLKKLTIDDIPEGYNYAVVNANGTAFAYEEKPTQVMHGWIGLGETRFIDYDFDTANWENSLIQKEIKEPIEKSMNESEPVFLENCTFNFTQEANCKADTDDDEELEIKYTSDLGLDRAESGFFVLKTEGWSISDERDIKRLLDRIKLLMNTNKNEIK